MRIIAKKALVLFYEKHKDAETALEAYDRIKDIENI